MKRTIIILSFAFLKKRILINLTKLKKMKKIILLTSITITLLSCKKENVISIKQDETKVPTLAASTNYEINLGSEFTFFDSCTNENVITSGTILGKFFTVTNNNVSVLHFTFNYSKVNAVGETSGKIYQAVGGVSLEFIYTPNTTIQAFKDKVTFVLGNSRFGTLFTFHAVIDNTGFFKVYLKNIQLNTCF